MKVEFLKRKWDDKDKLPTASSRPLFLNSVLICDQSCLSLPPSCHTPTPPWDWATQMSLFWVQGHCFRAFPLQPLCLEPSDSSDEHGELLLQLFILIPHLSSLWGLLWHPFSLPSTFLPALACIACSSCFCSIPFHCPDTRDRAPKKSWATGRMCAVGASSEWRSVTSSCWIAETFAGIACAQSPEIFLLMVKAEWGPASVLFKVPQVILICTQGSLISEDWNQPLIQREVRVALCMGFGKDGSVTSRGRSVLPRFPQLQLVWGLPRRGVNCEQRRQKPHLLICR